MWQVERKMSSADTAVHPTSARDAKKAPSWVAKRDVQCRPTPGGGVDISSVAAVRAARDEDVEIEEEKWKRLGWA